MKDAATTITPRGNAEDHLLMKQTLSLYASEPDLLALPSAAFEAIGPMVGADVVSYTELHLATNDFRALVSVQDDPGQRAQRMQAYARHMHSHPLWLNSPDFYGERALRESDFFSDEEFMALPIAQEVFIPSQAHRQVRIVIPQGGYTLSVAGWRVLGRPKFSDEERDRLEQFRPHLQRIYQQAQARTVAHIGMRDRLGYAFPELTPRQLDVAAQLAQGKTGEDIAAHLGIGIDTVKAHTKGINKKLGTARQVDIALLALTAPTFSRLPPLWKLGLPAWGADTIPETG
jgi:DNA-binding CsgD family transcriptional regulator